MPDRDCRRPGSSDFPRRRDGTGCAAPGMARLPPSCAASDAARSHANQCEVRSPAADVADQDRLPGLDQRVPVLRCGCRPRRRRRPAVPRATPRAAARRCAAASTVSSRAISSNEAGSVSTMSCSASGACGKLSVPGLTHVLQDARAHRDRRQPLDVRCAVPRQQVGRAIHAGMAEPGFGRRDQPSRIAPALVARKEAHRHVRICAGPRADAAHRPPLRPPPPRSGTKAACPALRPPRTPRAEGSAARGPARATPACPRRPRPNWSSPGRSRPRNVRAASISGSKE